ncbi:MAG TPA: hypothetical protein VKF62_01160, partial [Planctomycetota bacterium]|nr:hypothetical protein [Planctomycetota bacterium]
SGTIEVYYLLSLAAKVTSAAEDGMRLARAHSQAIGFMFSAFLGMAYALPWLIIRSRARALFEEDSDRTGPLPGGRRGWMRENGLDISLLREVPSLLAVVAPILSGSLAEVWGSIAKGG